MCGLDCGPERRIGGSMGKLTALKVKALTEPGSYIDGDGLMLVIGTSGAASWKLRVTIAGKRRDIGVGSLKVLSLADAARRRPSFVGRSRWVSIRLPSERRLSIPSLLSATLLSAFTRSKRRRGRMASIRTAPSNQMHQLVSRGGYDRACPAPASQLRRFVASTRHLR